VSKAALGILVFLTILTTYSLRTSVSLNIGQVPEIVTLPNVPPETESNTAPPPPLPPPELEAEAEKHVIPDHPKYKPGHVSTIPPIVDNFPLAAAAHSAAELPPIPPWNESPSPHVPEKTPLFIGFTRNWRLLQQAVVSHTLPPPK
jgi:hypothetical protein